MKKILLLLSFIYVVQLSAQCPINITAEYGIICNSMKVQLIASGATSYSWHPQPFVSTSINGDTVIAQPSASIIYTVTGITGTCTATNTVEVIVNNCIPPQVGFIKSTGITCVNHCIIFNDTTQYHSTKPLFYTWVFPGGSIIPVTGGSIIGDTLTYAMTNSTPLNPVKVCYHVNSQLNGNGYYPVTQIVRNGINQINTYNDSVKVLPGPTVNFSLAQDTAPHTWDVYPTYYSAAQSSSAIWYWGDGTSTAGLYPSHTYAVAGKYTISVSFTDITGCRDSVWQTDSVYRLSNSSMVTVNVLQSTTGISIFKTQNASIKIYPNPANDVLNVELEMLNGKAELKLFDVNGKQVLWQTINGKTIVDVSNLNAGVYNISIANNGGVVNKRLVIVR
ncbi:MAG TPA: T9SS type A sorting domain-containing protein [Bacteroidia bacterium]|nr:T9SS type A sorting domain-containing protein [Bacteroidia bacterium]